MKRLTLHCIASSVYRFTASVAQLCTFPCLVIGSACVIPPPSHCRESWSLLGCQGFQFLKTEMGRTSTNKYLNGLNWPGPMSNMAQPSPSHSNMGQLCHLGMTRCTGPAFTASWAGHGQHREWAKESVATLCWCSAKVTGASTGRRGWLASVT